jgi:hypothetical protein
MLVEESSTLLFFDFIIKIGQQVLACGFTYEIIQIKKASGLNIVIHY